MLSGLPVPALGSTMQLVVVTTRQWNRNFELNEHITLSSNLIKMYNYNINFATSSSSFTINVGHIAHRRKE